MKKQQTGSHKRSKIQTAKDDSYPVQLAEEYEFFGTKLKIEIDFADSLCSGPQQDSGPTAPLGPESGDPLLTGSDRPKIPAGNCPPAGKFILLNQNQPSNI